MLQSCASETRSPDGREQPDLLDRSLRAAILRQIAHHQVVAFLAFQHLRDRFAADGGFDRVLHVGDVDLVRAAASRGRRSGSDSAGR